MRDIPLDDVRNKIAYHSPNPHRSPLFAPRYWDSSAAWPNKSRPNEDGTPMSFDDCVQFLHGGKPIRFPHLGDLCSFLAAGDLSYTDAVESPTAAVIGKYIGSVGKGSAGAMRVFNLVPEKAEGKKKPGSSTGNNAPFIHAAEKLHQFLLTNLDKEEIALMEYEERTMEHALCKAKIAWNRKLL